MTVVSRFFDGLQRFLFLGMDNGLLYDGFFLCRRTAVVEAFGVQYKFNDLLNSQTMADTLSGKAIYTVE